MRVYLIRHGDKEAGEFWNPAIGGHNDNPLSARGRAEAEAAAGWLAERDIGAIFASRYGRTAETARPLAAALGLAVGQDARLDEIDVGITDRLTEDELRAGHPAFMAAYEAFETDFAYPGGESGGQAAARISSFLATALEGGRDLAAYTHDGLVRIAACLVLGLPPWERRRLRAETCGITELEWDEGRGRWDLVRLNGKIPILPSWPN
jgi:broad specificity phosphatase PhoE